MHIYTQYSNLNILNYRVNYIKYVSLFFPTEGIFIKRKGWCTVVHDMIQSVWEARHWFISRLRSQ